MNHCKRIASVSAAILLCIGTLCCSAHSGRTDSSGGHRDNKNKSGLGDYHYHHGYPAHLHPGGVCPYSSSNTNASYATSASTSTASNATYITRAEAPTITVKNLKTATGKYIVDENKIIFVHASGYGNYSFAWYAWSDLIGWYYLGSGADIDLDFGEVSGACIKVVANDNESLYATENVNIMEQPNFNYCQWHIDGTSGNVHNSKDQTGIVLFGATNETLPYTVALWDCTSVETNRKWYIKNDLQDCTLFSTEQGATCQLWTAGNNYIKIVHDDNTLLSEIVTFYVG